LQNTEEPKFISFLKVHTLLWI